jgi:hypothetical protein
MLIQFIFKGKRVTVSTDQVTVLTDDGRPCALSYSVDGGAIIHCDAADRDFGEALVTLGIPNKPGPISIQT